MKKCFQLMQRAVFATLMVALLPAIHSVRAQPTADQSITLETENPKLQAALATIIQNRKTIDNLGVVLANIHDFSPELVKEAKRELKFTDRLQIISLEKGSIADELGLKPGDQLIQINSFYVSRGRQALETFAERVMPGVDWNGSIKTTIIRDGFGQNYSINANRKRG